MFLLKAGNIFKTFISTLRVYQFQHSSTLLTCAFPTFMSTEQNTNLLKEHQITLE